MGRPHEVLMDVIVLSGGRSAHGARAAMSHTASLSGNYRVTHGAFQQAGVIEVYDPAELTDMARAFSKIHACPRSGGVAILTFSGGAGTITADLLHDYDMPLAQLSEDTLSEIGTLFPSWIKPTHPLDLWSSIEQKGYKQVYLATIKAALADPAVDSILLQTYTSLEIDAQYFADVAGLMREHGKPIILWVEGRKELLDRIRAMAEQAGMPAFRDLTRCVSVLAGLRRYYQKKR
jgi:acetyltransferase